MAQPKVFEGPLTEIIGTGDALTQNDFSQSITFTLPTNRPNPSGEILDVVMTSKETGGGAVQTPAGKVLFFDTDPGTAAGATKLSTGVTAPWENLIGIVPIAQADWISDVDGAAIHVAEKPVAFRNVSAIYAVFRLESTGAINNATGDLESLSLNIKYRVEA